MDIYEPPKSNVAKAPRNNSGQGKGIEIPDAVKGWSWGAFFLSWIWAIGNKTWIGLLALIPYVGIVMAFVLGIKGRQWAWENKQWESLDHFLHVQKRWSFWGVIVVVVPAVLGIIAAIVIPIFVQR
jgi:hypothetical protein